MGRSCRAQFRNLKNRFSVRHWLFATIVSLLFDNPKALYKNKGLECLWFVILAGTNFFLHLDCASNFSWKPHYFPEASSSILALVCWIRGQMYFSKMHSNLKHWPRKNHPNPPSELTNMDPPTSKTIPSYFPIL